MKTKITLFAALFFAILAGNAQQAVPNGGLNTWSSAYAPTGWTSLEDIISPIQGVGLIAEDMADKYEGSSSVKLTSKYVALAGDTAEGTLAIGTGLFTGSDLVWYGTPFTSSPDTLRFAYKYEPVGLDTAGFSIQLHKAGGSTYKLQYGRQLIPTAGQWVLVTLPLTSLYQDLTGNVDTLFLKFNSSNLSGGASPRQGSVLHIDAVSFGYASQAPATSPDAYTMGHDPLTGYDFNFYGAVNAQGDSGVYKFVYSTDSTFASSTSTPAQTLNGNTLKVVYATVTGLAPATTYYYRLKATTNQGTSFGQTMNFYSDTVAMIFENAGGDVFPNGTFIQLNGRLSKFQTNVNLFFEIGETPALGRVLVPDVTSVSDSFTHYFRSYPDSIVAGKLYFFRAKAVGSNNTYYTDIRAAYTGPAIYSMFDCLQATNLTDTSGDFNGQSQGFPLPVKHKVEIFNQSLGHFHSPFTYYAPSGNLNSYTYHKAGLQPGTYYSTRFKAETWEGNYYCDSAFTTTGIGTGINQPEVDGNIFVYPNPVNTHLNFAYGNNSENLTLKIVDIQGRELMNKSIALSNGLDVSTLAPGIYFIQTFNTTGQKTGVIRFIKQ